MSRLAADRSDLPRDRSTERVVGWAPDPHPRFGPPLVEAQHVEEVERDAHFRDGDTARFHHSDAGTCSRYLAYRALGLPESNPTDAPGHFITRLGGRIHEEWQARLQEVFAGVKVEVDTYLLDGEMHGHADVELPWIVDSKPLLVSVECKSLGGYAYKMAVGERGPAQGPKYNHLVQAALNAAASNADEAVVLYFARDAISIPAAKRKSAITDMMRVTAEWTMPREQYEPLAHKEIDRVHAILGLVDDGVLPARKVPDPDLPVGHLITNPKTGTWVLQDDHDNLVDGGEYWACVYCHYQDLCATTPAGRCPTEVLTPVDVTR